MKFSRRTDIIILLLIPFYAWGIYAGVAWLTSPARDHRPTRQSAGIANGERPGKDNSNVAADSSLDSSKNEGQSQEGKLSFTDYILIVIALLLVGITYMLWKRRPQSETNQTKSTIRTAKAVSAAAEPAAHAPEPRLPYMPWQVVAAIPFSLLTFLLGLGGAMWGVLIVGTPPIFLLMSAGEKIKKRRKRGTPYRISESEMRGLWALVILGGVLAAYWLFIAEGIRSNLR